MRLGEHIWGEEAQEAAAQLVVLEPGAQLPHPRASNRQLHLIAAHSDEPDDDFLARVGVRLSSIPVPVKEAIYCLNGSAGWKAALRRANIARRIARILSKSAGELTLTSPRVGEAQFTLELLTVVELVRRDYPDLNVNFRTSALAELDSEASDTTWHSSVIRFAPAPEKTTDEAA